MAKSKSEATAGSAGSTTSAPDGLSIAYRAGGAQAVSATAPALVFVHGLGGAQTHFEAQTAHFGANYRVVTLDLGGHGDSGREGRSAWDVDTLAGDVRAVVEALGLDHVVLIGHGLGGAVALEAACLMPGRTRALVGVDSWVYNVPYFLHTDYQADQLVTPLQKDFKAGMADLIRAGFAPEADAALVEAEIKRAATLDPASAVAMQHALLMWDALGALACMQTRAHAILGGWAADQARQQESFRRYPWYFAMTEVSGAGRYTPIEQPAALTQALESALALLLGAG